MEKRKWSKEEKLAILKEAKEHGREVTLRMNRPLKLLDRFIRKNL